MPTSSTTTSPSMPSTTSSQNAKERHPRLFVGIPVRLDAYDAIRKYFSPAIHGRWVDTAQLHLTLCFLGERFCKEEVFERLEDIDMYFQAAPVTGLGYFRRNHILYASAEHPSLQALASRIAAALELPVPTLTPHITLMRIKKIDDRALFQEELGRFEGHRLGMLERRSVLYESTLLQAGARYDALKVWPV